MPFMTRQPLKKLLPLLAVWVLLYCSYTLLTPAFLDGPDSMQAEAARQMMLRNDYTTCIANGTLLPNQMPLTLWMITASFQVFGVKEAAARFPLALTAFALAITLYVFASFLFRSQRCGRYAAGIFLLSPGLFFCTRFLQTAAPATLWICLAVFALWYAEQQTRFAFLGWLAFGCFCALGVLTQGIAGLLLPLMLLVVWPFVAYAPRTAILRHLRPDRLSAVFGFFLLSSPSHALQFLHPQWVPSATPLLLFWLMPVLFLAPWSVFLPQALRAVPNLRTQQHNSLSTAERAHLFLALWAFLTMLLFSLIPRSSDTVLQVLPPLCLLIASWLHQEATEMESFQVPNTTQENGLRSTTVLLLIGAVVTFGIGMSVLHMPQRAIPALDLLHQFHDLRTALHLLPQLTALLHTPLLFVAGVLFVGPLAAWWLRTHSLSHRSNMMLEVTSLLVLMGAHAILQRIAPAYTSRDLADATQALLKPTNLVVLNGSYQDGSSMGFYLQRDVHVLAPMPPHSNSRLCETDASFQRRWKNPERIFLWTDPEKLPNPLSPTYVIAIRGGKEVISNKAGEY